MTKPLSQHLTHGIHLIVICSLVLCAWLFAKGTNNLVMMRLYEMPGNIPHSRIQPESLKNGHPASEKASIPSGQPILERNIFSSKIGPILPVQQIEVDTAEEASDSSEEMPLVPCEGEGNQLLATVVSEETPDWSVAAISNAGEKSLYHSGDTVGSRELLDISWRHVFLKGDDDICYIDMFGEKNLQHVRKYGRRTLKTKIPRRFKKDVKLQGDTRIITKKLARNFGKKVNSYARQMRLRPYKKNGVVTGFRIRRLPSKNPLMGMGLKRGDVIHEVNGQSVKSVSGAIAALKSLKNQQRFTFAVTRRGKPGTVNVAVR